ncbi:DUF4159 domain-containing protein [Acidobacteria bacterium AH-259-G07]|nr:DUF4159 domain-containing protein [Acidobacteria bacterium AH-259-G07]
MRARLLLWIVFVGFSAARVDDRPHERQYSIRPEFTFLRLIYSGEGWMGSAWAVDYPKADRQFLYGLRKLTDFGFVNTEHRTLQVLEPELFHYPFLYAVEVGYMYLSDQEAAQLREYLLRGGFLVVDDFHGEYEWQNFYRQIKKVFPEYEPVELSITHPIFHCYYDIKKLIQIPGLQFVYSGRTWEKGGYKPRYMGIQDENGRLMVMINHNVDLGDAWEWAEVEAYPREYANLAFQLGINYIVYSMTH